MLDGPGAGITRGHELPDRSTGNLIEVLPLNH